MLEGIARFVLFVLGMVFVAIVSVCTFPLALLVWVEQMFTAHKAVDPADEYIRQEKARRGEARKWEW